MLLTDMNILKGFIIQEGLEIPSCLYLLLMTTSTTKHCCLASTDNCIQHLQSIFSIWGDLLQIPFQNPYTLQNILSFLHSLMCIL